MFSTRLLPYFVGLTFSFRLVSHHVYLQHVKKMRVRFIRSTMDTSERQSMQKACVSINYELVITVPEREDEIRCHANGIYLIEHGKVGLSFYAATGLDVQARAARRHRPVSELRSLSRLAIQLEADFRMCYPSLDTTCDDGL